MSDAGARQGLLGRRREREVLGGLLDSAVAGRSQALVLRGECGIGKTTLLDDLLEQAVNCRILKASGLESEFELPYAGLHQLCNAHLDRIEKLPGPQREALATAFGMQWGTPPDRFLVGLAVLTLLSGLAEEQPLLCVVDDAHWLDRASLQVLEFVARRLDAEPVAMVLAVHTRDGCSDLNTLPDLVLRGLEADDAITLLNSATYGPLDSRIRDRILAEAQGNPLALLELPHLLTSEETPCEQATEAIRTRRLVSRLEQGYLRQLRELPDPSRRMLLTAAAEPIGDPGLVRRAAERLGIDMEVALAAESAGWIDLRARVRFRHPLIRSTVYRAAGAEDRRTVHRALADVTDPDKDPDSRAWHRARAAAGPDEEVAADLERSAGRAMSTGALAAAAAFLRTAASLTPDPARRGRRWLEAAQATATAGSFGEASALLGTALAEQLDAPGQARAELLRAEISYNSGHGKEALPLYLGAARRLESVDPAAARRTYLDAFSAALFAGRLASPDGPALRQVAQAVRAAPAPQTPDKTDLVLDGLALLYTDGYAASAPVLHRAVRAFASADLTVDEASGSAWIAAVVAGDLWDDVHCDILTQRHLHVVREAKALSVLPLALATRAVFEIHTGDLAAATDLIADIRWVVELTGGDNTLRPVPEALLAAMRGEEKPAELLISDALADSITRGQGSSLITLQTARAVLCNGLGRYSDAMAAARVAAAEPLELGTTKFALAELVEAAVRSGNVDVANRAAEQISEMARAAGTEFALGTDAACRALVSEDAHAEELHREAVERLGRTRVRVAAARAQLRYGEWLRRQGRRADARVQLRAAHEALTDMGVAGFAERAGRELLATGETVRKRSVDTHEELTPQETHIARLAAEGRTNPEIAALLYISARTVEWHLRKVFTKLGVTSRRQLRTIALS